MKTYYIETYGCPLNKTDSATIEEILYSAGYSKAKGIEEADVVIINTCAVRLDTEEKMVKRLGEICGKAKRLIVTGCLASAQPAFVLNACRHALIVHNAAIPLILSYLQGGPKQADLRQATLLKSEDPHFYRNGPLITVPLADGCLDNCAYCITKLARPHLLSRKPERILAKLKECVSALPYEVVEVQLTGQDLAVYGYDLAKRPLLPTLLEEILSLEFRDKALKIRLGMMTPNRFRYIMDDVLGLMQRDSRIYRFLHLPVQSGDDRVLRLMRRGYTVEEFEEIVSESRRRVPGIQIATDIIVGHPGEDEEAFSNTLRLIERLKIERVHVAQYTPRPHTLSARLPQVHPSEKKRRSSIVTQLCARIGLEWHRTFVGRRVEVHVVEKFYWKGSSFIVGRTDNYVSVVLHNAGDEDMGRTLPALITEATPYDLRGVLDS